MDQPKTMSLLRDAWPALLVQLLVTVPLALATDVWVDEMYTWHTTSQGLGFAFDSAVGFERQAPGYFVLLWAWRQLADSLLWCRMLSVACAAVATLAVVAVVRRASSRVAAIGAGLLMAVSPQLIAAALEVRVYAMAMMWAALLVAVFARDFLPGRPDFRRAAGFVGLATVSLYTFYYLGFVLAALAAALALLARWASLRTYLACMCAVGLLCIPLFLWLPDQVAHPAGVEPPAGSVVHETAEVLRFAEPVVLPPLLLLSDLDDGALRSTGRWGLRVLVLLALAGVLGRARRPPDREGEFTAYGLVALLLAVVAQYGLVAALFGRHLIEADRYKVVLVPIALAAALVWLGRRMAPWSLAGLVALLSLCAAIESYDRHGPPFRKDGSAREIATWLREHAAPDDLVGVFPNELALPLRYHLPDWPHLVPIPRPVPLEVYDPRAFAVTSEAEVVAALRGTGLGAPRTWLVRRSMRDYWGVSYGGEVLDRAIAASMNVLERHRVAGVEVLAVEAR
jgi:hypothetical protein